MGGEPKSQGRVDISSWVSATGEEFTEDKIQHITPEKEREGQGAMRRKRKRGRDRKGRNERKNSCMWRLAAALTVLHSPIKHVCRLNNR